MRALGLVLAVLACVAAIQGAAAQSGNDNGAYNYGTNNGGNNGNTNTNGLANGNGNGNYNGNGGVNYQGYLNSIPNIGAGNANGNGNTGLDNGIANGNYNANGANTGNGNGNNNVGLVNGIGNGNFNGQGVTNVGNNNGNGNLGVANGVGNGNFLDSGSNVGNNNGNGNLGSGNGNGNGNGVRGTAGQGSGNANGVPKFPPGFQSSGNGNTNGNGNGQATSLNTPRGGGTGDPIMTGFDGRAFEFLGTPEAFYNIISERHHQVSTKLKLGELWDHNGTYMEGFGFQYRDHGIIMELDSQDELIVTVNGEQLTMTKGETELEMIPYVEGGELVIVWQKHREGLGNAIEITTELLQVIVWVTPAGTIDEGGKEQPAYLNFDVALLGPPSGSEMQGIVGETYNRMLAGDAVKDVNSTLYLPDDYQFHGKGLEADYQVSGYFGEHAYSLFGKDRKRVLIEADSDVRGALVAYPLLASGRPGARQLAAVQVFNPPATVLRVSRRMGRF